MFDSELELYCHRSGQDQQHDTLGDYLLEVDVGMDGLHTRLVRDTFAVDEMGHAGSVLSYHSGEDALSNYSPGGPSSKPHDLSHDCWRVGGLPRARAITFEFGEFLLQVP
jgi:hypothetical protein